MKNLIEKFAAQIKSMKHDIRGIAAVEFAMVLPILVIMLIGTFELGQALTIDRRIIQAASSTADLVAQAETIDDAGLTTIMDLMDTIVDPYDTAPLQISIISVVADAAGDTTVGWSYSKGGGEPYAQGSSYSMTGGLANLISPLTSVIIAEVNYNFVPSIAYFFPSGFNLSETFYLRPRKSMQVTKM